MKKINDDFIRLANDDDKIDLTFHLTNASHSLSNAETLHSSYPFGPCLTFFSRLYQNRNSSDILRPLLAKSKLESSRATRMELSVSSNADERVEAFEETVFVQIHSRMSLYDFEVNAAEMKSLEFGKRYKVFVNEEITDRQPPPYDTMCHWYDESDNLLEKADRHGNDFDTEKGLSQVVSISTFNIIKN